MTALSARPVAGSAAMTERDAFLSPDTAVPVFRPYLGPEVRGAAAAALEAGWLGMGSSTREFEVGIEEFIGARGMRHAVTTNSCTEALHLAALIAGLGPGDEIICPSFTYVAGHQAVGMTGAEVVFCDVEEDTLGVDVESVRALITDKTRAIMAVHYAGLPPRDLAAVRALALERGLRVIEDAAHAFGSVVNGTKVGADGDLTCFSFGPVKILTSLEGGAVITGNVADVQVLHELRLIGVDSDTDARYRNARTWQYDVVRQGYRCHLGSVPAAIGLSQLDLIDEFIANRQGYCRYYDAAFRDVDGVRLFQTDWSGVSPFIYVIRVADAATRDALMAHLKEQGVASGIHFLGAHDFTHYAGNRRGDLSVTERVSDQVVTLPLHSYMDDATLDRVVSGVRSFFAESA